MDAPNYMKVCVYVHRYSVNMNTYSYWKYVHYMSHMSTLIRSYTHTLIHSSMCITWKLHESMCPYRQRSERSPEPCCQNSFSTLDQRGRYSTVPASLWTLYSQVLSIRGKCEGLGEITQRLATRMHRNTLTRQDCFVKLFNFLIVTRHAYGHVIHCWVLLN